MQPPSKKNKKCPHNLYNRRQFLQGLMLINIRLSRNHMDDNMWMLSSSAAILKISIRMSQVIVIYAVQIIHCRCWRDNIDVCGIFMNIDVVVVARLGSGRRHT
jgi:hypothetical protein